MSDSEFNLIEINFNPPSNYYTRNQDGAVFYFETFEQALEDFLSYNGYRLSVETEFGSFHLHRDELPITPNNDPNSLGYYNPEFSKRYEALVNFHPNNNQ
jgi:hypothetical protein